MLDCLVMLKTFSYTDDDFRSSFASPEPAPEAHAVTSLLWGSKV